MSERDAKELTEVYNLLFEAGHVYADMTAPQKVAALIAERNMALQAAEDNARGPAMHGTTSMLERLLEVEAERDEARTKLQILRSGFTAMAAAYDRAVEDKHAATRERDEANLYATRMDKTVDVIRDSNRTIERTTASAIVAFMSARADLIDEEVRDGLALFGVQPESAKEGRVLRALAHEIHSLYTKDTP